MKRIKRSLGNKILFVLGLALSIFLLQPHISSGMNMFQKTYESQKILIGDAQKEVEEAVKDTSENTKRVSQAQTSTENAVRIADEAIDEQKKTNEQDKRLEILLRALDKTKSDLENAELELKKTNSDLVDMKAKLEKSQNALILINENNEKVGEKAGVFDIIQNGLYASLIANFLTVATFLLNWPKRKTELKLMRKNLELKDLELKKARKEANTA